MKNGWGAGEDGTTQRGAFNTKSPYTSLRDMFDGGGAGATGDEFKGGGLLSYFANMLGKPLSPQEAAQAPQAAAPVQAASTSTRGYITPPAAPERPPMQYSGRGDVGMPQPPMQYGGRGSYGMPQQMQMPNLMDTMAGARSGRAEDAFLNSFGYQDRPQPMQYGGRGDYGMPGPRRSMTLQEQKEAEIRAYLEGL